MALLFALQLAGPCWVVAEGGNVWVILLLPLVIVCMWPQRRQPGLGCELGWFDGHWWWRPATGEPPLRMDLLNCNLAAPLATGMVFRESVSGRVRQLNLFHDSVCREELSALRRRLVLER